MADADLVARLRLIRTRSIGPIAHAQLIRRFGSAAAALAAIPDLARRGGGSAPAIPGIATAEAEIAAVERLGARYLVRGEPPYPALLAETEDAPALIVAAGDAGLAARRCVAIVGARNASAAAVRFARQIASELSAEGITIVSGLARGIDTAAHAGSLDGGTVAVVAGGIDVCYPPENETLQHAIAERGMLFAEHPPGTEPRARHFPYRNRVIAGMTMATVVIEAAPKSGSLITARMAADAGREVLAVPGSPLDPRAQGCNQLIRDGATLVQSAADILESLGTLPLASRLASPASAFDGAPPADIDASARGAVESLLSPSPAPIDEIIRLSGLAPAIVQTALLELELAGRLARHAGGRVSLHG